ncbi:Holliday junction resolvase RecU [Aneurinibacillus sp. XH2]|uniref:Holliday junction resolvase RecU n=2 Tax=Aneurinibacillus thermoaerophilus TaxID=143495 RepID=A0ABX8YBM1_ANETH|nr:Holliday junction resolvase RecU [Aneurinibacillus sp. XH2]QYY43096.1 Holliday junction resolvase RecU [Aneurinibacillus thermoaerophilus]
MWRNTRCHTTVCTSESDAGVAVINKRPTPIKVLYGIVGHFKSPSTVDYEGAYAGRSIVFEAKSTKELRRFPLRNIAEHQVEYLAKYHRCGAISFLLVEFAKHQTVYLLPYEVLAQYWQHTETGGQGTKRMKGRFKMSDEHFEEQKRPLWAYITVAITTLFLLAQGPKVFLLPFFPFMMSGFLNRPFNPSVIQIFFLLVGLTILAVAVWLIVKAIRAIIKDQKRNPFRKNKGEFKRKGPLWAWIVIAIFGLGIIWIGPGILMLPILPLIMAGFSADSPNTPEYVPLMVMGIGYALLIGCIVLFISAIRAIKK